MDGSGRIVFVQDGLQRPTGLDIDVRLRRYIYTHM